MDRRNFNGRMIAAAACLTGLPAVASGDNIGLAPFGRVALRIGFRTIRIHRFLIMTGDGIQGVDLRLDVQQMPAARIDLGDVPLLGQLLTPTLPRQFAGAEPVGSLHLVGRSIVLLPDLASVGQRKHVWITHRGAVFRPPASLKPLPSTVTAAQAKAAPKIGTAVAGENIILGIVPPSVLDTLWPKASTPT